MRNGSRLISFFFPLILGSLSPLPIHAQWVEGSSTPVCVAPGQQTQPVAVPDGFGGVIAAWLDCRNGCSAIYAQRLNALGYPLWGADGVLAASQSPSKSNLVIVGDGAGGAIIAWVDRTQDRTGATSLNVYAQKIDASGNLAAALTGIPICTAKNNQNQLCMVPDGSGGAIVAWTDWRRWDPEHPMFEYSDVFVQRIDHDGNTSWDIDGRELVWGDRMASPRSLIYVGRGGAILSYDNCYPSGYCDSYMTRITPGGNSLWTLPLVGDQLVSNGAGGVIDTWISADSTRGQWIDSAGVAQWGPGGKTILPGMKRSDGVSDGRGDAIFIGSGLAQRVDSNGDRVWSPGGVNIGVDGPLISDGFGGAIVGTTAVQRVDSAGNILWAPGGVPTSAGANTHLIPDEAEGVILVYGNQDIRAQRVNPLDHGPVLAAIGAKSVNVGDTLRVQLSATDADMSDVLTFSTNAAGLITSPFSFDPQSGLFSWAPRRGDAGDYLVTFAVTDGIFSDTENVTISVFDAGDRPPVLQPIQDITISAGSPVVVEAIASDPDTDAIMYAMADPRFSQNGNIFRWQTTSSNTGTYYFSVSASDGHLTDTTTVKVVVLAARFYFYGHDAMDGEPGSWFLWHTNDAFWSADFDGYLSGSNGSWYSAAVSERVYGSSSNPTVNFRLEFVEGQTNYILGFTPTAPDETNFSYNNVTLGLYLHSGGSIRPSWSINDTGWTFSAPDGVLDVRVTILSGEGKVRLQLQHVDGFDAPLSTFTNPDWSVEVARPLEEQYYVQINLYNSTGRAYDVWAAPEGPKPVLHVAGALSVREEEAAVIEASADYAGDWPLAYWISDPRYSGADSVFTWRTHVGDAGVYRPVVYVSDGYANDSASVNVTVTWELDPPGWNPDGTPVCNAPGVQDGAQIVSDGYGGVIIAWIDRRYGNAEIFAQRLDADGIPQWAPNGVPVCTDAAGQSGVQIVSDGDHGAYVVWRNGSTNLLAQRLDSDGNLLWTINGVAVGYGHYYENWLGPSHIALGGDGSLLTAYIERWLSGSSIWGLVGLTSFSPAGALRFQATFGNVLEALQYVDIAADPFGGAVLCYGNEYFAGPYSAIWRVGGNGSIVWSGTFMEGVPYVASDGVGGAIVCVAGESGTKDIWAQRFTPTGQAAWTAGGIPICTASGSQSIIGLESSGADRFTVAWLDTRSGSNDIYAQSVDTAGTTFWQADGARINASHGVQGASCMTPDGAGGAFIAWSDGPLFMQHITSMGAPLWDAGTDTLRSGVYSTGSLVLARAEECGVVAAWNDDRNGEMDIFANSKSTGICNHPPVLAAIGHKRADVGVELSIQLAASDPDAGTVLIYGTNAGSVLPSAFSFDANTGLFSWTPVSGDAGDYSVTFSVTDGVYEDSETIIIGVFEHGTRPPVIEPIADVTIFAGAMALLEAHASDPDGDALVYSISDARFTQNDSVFSWQTAADDAGTYHLIVSVTDGHLADSTTVTVRVLQPPPYNAYHDPMTGLPGSPFSWSEKGVVWSPEEEGYLSGTAPASWWSQAVVSARALNALVDSQVVFRVQFIQGSTTYIFGFTETPPSVTDFHRDKVDLGLYLRLGGGLRPSWSINDTPGTWTFTVPSGVADVRITLHKGRQTVSFDLENVSSYGDPLSTFSAPDWSAEMSRPIGDAYYVQINLYNSVAKVYDVWLEAPCGGPILQPIDDVVVWEREPAVIAAHAVSGCGRALSYRISDLRYVAGESTFAWQTQAGDAGVYHPVVFVTDGILTDSTTVNITVLRQFQQAAAHDSMAACADTFYAWHENSVVWHPEEGGYLSGTRPASRYSAVISEAWRATASKPSVIIRFLRSGEVNCMAGFTSTPPRETDFHCGKIDWGMSIDSTGSICPTWDTDNPEYWNVTLPEGVYDLKIDLDQSNSTATFALVRVPRSSDALPDFSATIWKWQGTREIADTCYVQVNPYNGASRIFDVWSYQEIAPKRVSLRSFSSSAENGDIVVTWTIVEDVGNVRFSIFREENNNGIFKELSGITIDRDSLRYTFRDASCKPNTAYRYRVEAQDEVGRLQLFSTSVKIPPLPFRLLQNHPNPFTELTTFGYELPSEKHVTLDVFTVQGRHIARLMSAKKEGGRHTATWNGRDDQGRSVSAGIYFYRIDWGGRTISRKMILLK